MLYAASVKVSYRKTHRRIDVIVEAADPAEAQEKALKQARSIYAPGKKAVYAITGILSETEALESLAVPVTSTEAESPDEPDSR